MARIAYLLLCHKDVDGIADQARALAAAGDRVAVHFDAAAPQAEFLRLRGLLDAAEGVVVVRRRVRCGWGEWSLVEATLETLRTALAAFPEATHFYTVSGDCMPIKSAEFAHAFLDAAPADHIESVDFFRSGWIRTGMREERLIYRHYFNERRNKRLFYAAMELQRRLGLRRRFPAGLQIMIGSQWWCLRRETVQKVLEFCARRPDVQRFFRTTWIPDETFFQTLVRHLVPEREIRSRPPTFLVFTDYGMPATFYDDHHDFLLAQEGLFARKISPDALELRRRLGALYAETGQRFEVTGDGRALFAFLTGQGRIGQRFAPRFWEAESSVGRARELLILVCRRRRVGLRLAAAIHAETRLLTLGYVFDDATATLPDLGGIEATLEKRTRHRRLLTRMLFDHLRTDRMLICVEPGNIDVLRDFAADRALVRCLEVVCRLDESGLAEEGRRRGLHAAATAGMVETLMSSLRNAAQDESERLREAGFEHFSRLCETEGGVESADGLAAFLGLPAEAAARIAARPGLFGD